MNPGKMRDRVMLRRPKSDQTTDSLGGTSFDFADTGTVAAKVRQMGGQERMIAQAVFRGASHEVTVRYQSELDSDGERWRLKMEDGTEHAITGIESMDRNKRYLKLMTQRVVS